MTMKKDEWKPVYTEQKLKLEKIIILFNKGVPVTEIAEKMGLTKFAIYRYLRVAGLHGLGAARDPATGRFTKSG